ncbi:MAG: hypothetical protein Ct9H300mP11_13550 [Chloroflexota bacterium]|nr:MAG: hypothetical protein Ct9H300mP11_13550 [Chloroflexota bacterium]
MSPQIQPKPGSSLAGPTIVPAFVTELDRLVNLARRGHQPDSALITHRKSGSPVT